MGDGLSRSALLRGGLAVAATGVSVGTVGAGPVSAAGTTGAASIEDVYREQTRRAGGTWCSLVTAGRGGETVISERIDTEIRAASVNKLAMAVAVLDRVDAGALALDQKVELTADAITSGTGSSGMWFLQKVYGDRLTLANVLTSLLLLSEDSALPLIASVLPADELNKVLVRKGFEVTQVEPDTENPGQFFHGFTTPREMHDLLSRLAGGDLLSRSSTAFMLDIVRWSEPGYTDGIRRNMSSDERALIGTKYGSYQDRRHEVGIVFAKSGAPALVFAMLAYGLGDEENFGATHPAVEARAVIGRTMLDAVG